MERRRFVLAAMAGAAGTASAPWTWASEVTPDVRGYNVVPRRVGLLKPGTVFENGPPKGWTNLVIKSFPRIADEDVGRVAPITVRLASFIFTAFVVNVEPVQGSGQVRYRISDVGQGLGVNVRGKDVIITPETQQELGADLGIVYRTVFSLAYDRQKESRIAAYSNTMAIVDTYAVMRRNDRNRGVVFRYALLCDPESGRIDSLVWVIDRDPQSGQPTAHGPIEHLKPNLIETPLLYVDDKEFTLGVPSNEAYGVLRPPKGESQIPLEGDLRELAGLMKFSGITARDLEVQLRRALARSMARR